MTVEDIILDRDRRGMTHLRPHLPSNYAEEAARVVLDNPGTAIIVTGFYILTGGADETDGPPGAVVIGEALQSLGYEVVYVTDRHGTPIMDALAGDRARIVDFPITSEAESRGFAEKTLTEVDPSVVISIERCGLTAEDDYRNMRGLNIGDFNARVDYLFDDHPNTVGIGDGGNEIGMGNLADVIPSVESLPDVPCVTTTTKLLIASVSNWGGYGLVAAMSELEGKNLLPSIEHEAGILKRSVEAGAVDGMSTKQENKVDGFTLEENSQTVQALHDYLAESGIDG